jgi:hypothetical protein
MVSKDDENSVSLIYNACKDALQIQEKSVNILENKANTLTAFAGGMFALLMGASDNLTKLPSSIQRLIISSIILFALSVIACTIVTWVRRYRTDPDIVSFSKDYLEKPEQDSKLQLISNFTFAWKRNAKILEGKAKFLRFAFICQSSAFTILGIALLMSVLQG